jgi:hypothetical protein
VSAQAPTESEIAYDPAQQPPLGWQPIANSEPAVVQTFTRGIPSGAGTLRFTGSAVGARRSVTAG